jgi:hypothetical protein
MISPGRIPAKFAKGNIKDLLRLEMKGPPFMAGVPRARCAVLLISILTVLMVPSGAAEGPVIARYLISSLGCAAFAWLISIPSMLELRRRWPAR